MATPAERTQAKMEQMLTKSGYQVDREGYVAINGVPHRVTHLKKDVGGSWSRVAGSVGSALKGTVTHSKRLGLRSSVEARSMVGAEVDQDVQAELGRLKELADREWSPDLDTKSHWGTAARSAGRAILGVLSGPGLFSKTVREWAFQKEEKESFYTELNSKERADFHITQQLAHAKAGYNPRSGESVANFMRTKMSEQDGPHADANFRCDQDTGAAMYVDQKNGHVLFAPQGEDGKIDWHKVQCIRVTKKGKAVRGQALRKFARSYALGYDSVMKAWGEEISTRLGKRFTTEQLDKMQATWATHARKMEQEKELLKALTAPPPQPNVNNPQNQLDQDLVEAGFVAAMNDDRYRPLGIQIRPANQVGGSPTFERAATPGTLINGIDNLTPAEKNELASNIMYNRFGETRPIGDERLDLELRYMEQMKNNVDFNPLENNGTFETYLTERYGAPPNQVVNNFEALRTFYANKIHEARKLPGAETDYQAAFNTLKPMAHRSDLEYKKLNGTQLSSDETNELNAHLARTYPPPPPLPGTPTQQQTLDHTTRHYQNEIQKAYKLVGPSANIADSDARGRILAEQLKPLMRGYTPKDQVLADIDDRYKQQIKDLKGKADSPHLEGKFAAYQFEVDDESPTVDLSTEEKEEIFNYLAAIYPKQVGDHKDFDALIGNKNNCRQLLNHIAQKRRTENNSDELDKLADELLALGKTTQDKIKKAEIKRVSAEGPGHLHMKDPETWRVYPKRGVEDGKMRSLGGFFDGWDVKLERKKEIKNIFDPKSTEWGKQKGWKNS